MYQRAIEDYTEAINLKLGGLRVHDFRGKTKFLLAELEAKQDNTEVVQRLYQEIVTESDNALGLKEECKACRSAIHFTRGDAEAALENHEAAIEDYNKALELNPKYLQAYINRGNANQAIGKSQEADEDFTKAKELESS